MSWTLLFAGSRRPCLAGLVALPALALLLVAAQQAGPRPAAPPAGAPTIADLAFLAGSWTGGDGSSRWESCYSTPEGGQIVGASKEVKDGHVEMIDFEHFYVREGQLRMTPFPFGKRSVEFTAVTVDGKARRALFENAAHDWPTKFSYEAAGDDKLRIVLSGPEGVPPGTVTIELSRVK